MIDCEPREASYRVSALEPVTPTIVEASLRPLGEAIAFRAGQYALLEDPDRRLPPRSYSFASAPRPDGEISLLVTRVRDGITSSWIHTELRVGDEVVLTGPYGDFVRRPSAAPCLYLAAGSGLAPIRALVESSLADSPRRSATLVFSARGDADLISEDLFAAWQASHRRFRFVAVLTGAARGRRVPELLPEICPDLGGHEVFAAGSPGFVLASTAAAEALGAAPDQVHSEPFFVAPA